MKSKKVNKRRRPTVDGRRGVAVGPAFGQVAPVVLLFRGGFFPNEDEARGAFRLAHEQGLDGMGHSVQDWMGLTEEEFEAWFQRNELPRASTRLWPPRARPGAVGPELFPPNRCLAAARASGGNDEAFPGQSWSRPLTTELTPKQRLFALEYLVDCNATQAAIRAGYSAKTAEQQGPRLLGIVGVRQVIEQAMKARMDKLGLSADRVLQELMHLAFVDVRKAYGADGKLLPLHDIPEEVGRAIVAVESEEQTVSKQRVVKGEVIRAETQVPTGVLRRVRWADKVRALEMLGKYFKLFIERHEVTGKDGAPLGVIVLPAKEPDDVGDGEPT